MENNEFVGAAVMVPAGLGFLALLLFGGPLPMWLRGLLMVVALVAAAVGLVIRSGGSGGSGGGIGDGGYGPGGGGL
ncbi:hypothetical protein ACIQ9P_26725 [Kitasatospora sp. NPDC094019]|uniref:hypothetical protein n=1 Tax=Kitasatospora sp. NPDC094019 TaxID=3364091 RepID=UPI00381202B4